MDAIFLTEIYDKEPNVYFLEMHFFIEWDVSTYLHSILLGFKVSFWVKMLSVAHTVQCRFCIYWDLNKRR